MGMRQMLALIGDSDNIGSIGMHASLGFTRAGVMRACGVKFGRWLDVVIMQRSLGLGGPVMCRNAGGTEPKAGARDRVTGATAWTSAARPSLGSRVQTTTRLKNLTSSDVPGRVASAVERPPGTGARRCNTGIRAA